MSVLFQVVGGPCDAPRRGHHVNMRTARTLAGAAAVACLGLLLAGCGDEGAGASSTPSNSPSVEPTTVEPSSADPATPTGGATTVKPSVPPSADPGGDPGFPMTVSRTGGVVGFSDAVSVMADGRATVSVKGRSGSCQVDATLLAEIAKAAQKINWQTLPAKPPTPRFPDDLVLAVSGGGYHLRLDDPKAEGLRTPLNKLLGDVDNQPANRKLCK